MTVREGLNRGNPNDLGNLNNLAVMGDGLSQNGPRTEQLVVAAHIATPSRPARTILSCFIVAAGANTGEADISKKETVPPLAGDCAINEDGNIQFAAADAVTACEVTYIPVEGVLIEDEIIPVTAGGVGTLLANRSSVQIVSASLNAPAATPGAKTAVVRGTLVGALGAGEFAVQFAGTTLAFVAAEAGVACTATVSYYALPGVGDAAVDTFGGRLEADYDGPGLRGD
jgi:hypothetical protein